MKAIVKVAYFDDLGLHKVGDVVEVKALKSFHKAIETEEVKKPVKIDEPVTETVEAEPTKKEAKKATKTTKKAIKKPVKKG